MAGRRRKGRIYWRTRGGASRAYADFRDVGGGREALIPSGESLATTDPVIAEKLVADRLEELQQRRRDRVLLGIHLQAGLQSFAAQHLIQKARSGRFTEKHLERMELCLRRAAQFFGADRDLGTISTADIGAWVNDLQESRRLSGSSVRQHLAALSNLYKRARAERCVPPGYNPVTDLLDKPSLKRREARWLEVHEAALLLEGTRTHHPLLPDRAMGHVHPIIATFLLTGGRKAEILGREVADVSFDRRTVTFRPNRWRRLKTATSRRCIPLWPQLEQILREYVFGGGRPLGSLLFPSVRGNPERMVVDLRKALDAIAVRAGWQPGEIRTKIFRHTYCATRLQTLDRGAPVSEYTVAKELGHGGRSMVERVYGHLGQIRHRSEMVEYRVEQHEEVLGERLVALRAQRA